MFVYFDCEAGGLRLRLRLRWRFFYFLFFSNVSLSYWIFILSCEFAMWCGMEDRRGCWVVGEVVLGILTLFREVGWGVLGMGWAGW